MNCPACGARWSVDDNGEPTPNYSDPLEDWRSQRERWLESEIDRLTTARNDFRLLAADLSNKLYDATEAARRGEHRPIGYDNDGRPFDCAVCGCGWPCPTTRGGSPRVEGGDDG